MTQLAVALHEVSRAAMQRWLPLLDAWLLAGSIYSVQHTWPQLYRSDGGGRFFVATDGDRLLSHCALRTVTLHGERGTTPIHLLGSVATDPDLRGQGLATAVLASALAAADATARHTLLWAERPELYARAGFAPGRPERCLTLLRRPRRPLTDHVRPATIADHATLHALHGTKPLRIDRSPAAMSGLLTTPGMSTFVLERDGAVVAYACTGKGADLHGFWHELGGCDQDPRRTGARSDAPPRRDRDAAAAAAVSARVADAARGDGRRRGAGARADGALARRAVAGLLDRRPRLGLRARAAALACAIRLPWR